MKTLTKSHKIKLSVALVCALLVCLAFGLIFGIKQTAPNKSEDVFSCYDLDLCFDGNNKVFAKQEVLYRAPKGVDSDHIVFNIYANAYSTTNDTIDILSAQIDTQSVDYVIYGKNNTLLRLPCDIHEDDIFTFYFEYTITLQNQNARLGKTDEGIVNLSCFYPVVAVWQDGWREDDFCFIGDPFVCDASSYFVRISCNNDFEIATSGCVYDTIQNGKLQTVCVEANRIRDFAVVIGNMQKATATAHLDDKDVDVSYFYTKDLSHTTSLDRIVSSVQAFSRAFGQYPYPSLTIVQSALDDVGGMEYGTLAVVSPSLSQEDYLNSITHEIAHQWWYNAVGNDQINCAWLDEGLSEFCTFYYHYLCGDRQSFANEMKCVCSSYTAFASHTQSVGYDGQMNKPLSQYLTNGEYVATVYLKGAMLFDLLHDLVGDSKFCSALSCYFENNLYQIATQQSLIDAFKQQGYDIRPILENFLS